VKSRRLLEKTGNSCHFIGMSKKAFRIRPYAHQRLKFVVSSHIAGKRQRKFFETKKAAETYVHLKEIELLNHGKEGSLLSMEDRILSQRATEILKPYGKTVLEAADFYAQHLKKIAVSRKVSEVLKELLAARKADGASADYVIGTDKIHPMDTEIAPNDFLLYPASGRRLVLTA
jgi:hypothetical protein